LIVDIARTHTTKKDNNAVDTQTKRNLTRKKWKPPRKKEKGKENPTSLSPMNRKVSHIIITALMQSIAKKKTQSTMKNDVALTHAAHPPQTFEREVDRRTKFCMRTKLSKRNEREFAAPMSVKRRSAAKIAKRSTNSTAIGANRPPSFKAKG
jgi:hypothetical protein